MKRSSPSFVVQHKRRSRAPNKDEPASIWSDDVGRELRGMLRETTDTPPDAAAPAPAKAGKKRAAAIAPKRILEAREEPVAVLPPEAEAPPPRRGRPRKQREEVAAPVEEESVLVEAQPALFPEVLDSADEAEVTLQATGEEIAEEPEAETFEAEALEAEAFEAEEIVADDDDDDADIGEIVEDDDDEDAEVSEAVDEPESIALPGPAPVIDRQRLSFSERRRAARKALPLADRWRWNLRY